MARVSLNAAAIRGLGKSKGMKQTLDGLGDEIAQDAQQAAPKRTGRGARSIHHELGEDNDGAFVRVSWSPDAFYMFFVEVGTSQVGARPFLRPAVQKSRTI